MQFCCPFLDIEDPDHSWSTTYLQFFTDASRNPVFGVGGIFRKEWFFAKWEEGYIQKFQPSIAYLELYALCAGIFIWQNKLWNMRVIVNCDNQTVRDDMNALTSGCKNCMYLIRMLTLNNLQYNRRIFVQYVKSKFNKWVDALSRQKINYFKRIAPPGINRWLEKMPLEIWPA